MNHVSAIARPGLYADILPPRALTLPELVDAAALADKRNDYRGSDAEVRRKEAEADHTLAALKAHLRGLGLSAGQMADLGFLL